MANEDKPRGRPGKPAGGRATQGKGPGGKPRGAVHVAERPRADQVNGDGSGRGEHAGGGHEGVWKAAPRS